MRPSRARESVARTLLRREIEERLDEMLRQSGEAAIQKSRDNAWNKPAPFLKRPMLLRIPTKPMRPASV